MLTTILLVIGIFGVLFFIMSIGVIFGRIRLRGSCGGLGSDSCACSSAADCKKR